MTLQKMMGYIRRAADDYNMICEGDKIAVGLSGGKDSMTLLEALAAMRGYYPVKYTVCAITVSLGFAGTDFNAAARLCERLGVEYFLIETDIGGVVFNDRAEKNPCSLCSKMRKGALYEKAARTGCNKVALGHNKDDVIQTFFLSMLYEGRIHTFSPVTYLDRKNVTAIRPLIYAPEKEIKAYIKKSGAEIIKNPCPIDGQTKREDMKIFIREQSKKHKSFEEKIFNQIARLPLAGWEKVQKKS